MALFKKKVAQDVDESLTNGANLPNTNDQDRLIRESLDEKNNPVVQGEHKYEGPLYRQKGESQQAYNERIPVALQPVQPMSEYNYLGKKVR